MGREVKRVPVDFDWPRDKVWEGFLMPDTLDGEKCSACDGRGESPDGRRLHDLWYGYRPFVPEDNGSTPLTADTPGVRAFAERNIRNAPEFYGRDESAIVREAWRLARMWNEQWSHHLNEEDVAALLADGRLMDLTHHVEKGKGWVLNDPPTTPTAAEVNDWSTRGMGHDAINSWVVIRARAEREGLTLECAVCDGHGATEVYPGQRDDAEAWESTEPPEGEGWQLWETTSEGSPIGPVFASGEELAQWLTTDEGGSAVGFGRSCTPMAIDEARGFVGVGWAPSAFGNAGGFHSGAHFVGTQAVLGAYEDEASR